jgi:hypothetical protein
MMAQLSQTLGMNDRPMTDPETGGASGCFDQRLAFPGSAPRFHTEQFFDVLILISIRTRFDYMPKNPHDGDLPVNILPAFKGGEHLAAARLVNFPTGYSTLLHDHEDWLNANVEPHFTKPEGAWVDLIAYASRRGNSAFNLTLSKSRMESVKNKLLEKAGGADVEFNRRVWEGDTEDKTVFTDNWGYWRAVEVYVYGGSKPAIPPKIEPIPPPSGGFPTSSHWKARIHSIFSFSWNIAGPKFKGWSPPAGIGGDIVFFEIVDLDNKRESFFSYTGGGAGMGTPSPPGIWAFIPSTSLAGAGPFKEFETSAPVSVEDFDGAAALKITRGASWFGNTVGGSVELKIMSSGFRDRGAYVTSGGSIAMTTDSGLGLGLGSGSVGKLTIDKKGAYPVP